MQATFVDGMTNLSVTGQGLVKFEFGLANPIVDEQGEKKVSWTTTQQLVLPMDGFLRAFGIQEQVIKKMIEDGLLQQREPTSSPDTPPQ